MNASVIWLGDQECLIETSDRAYSVTDPHLISTIRNCIAEAAVRSNMQIPGSQTAATLASLLDTASVRPHEEISPATGKTLGFGRALPPMQVSTLPEVDFATVLENRHSIREFRTPSHADILSLLTHSARSRFVWLTKNGQPVSSRPSPSAGARHPIEIVVVALKVYGLIPGFYWFDPVLCRLRVLSTGHDEVEEVAVRAQAALAVDTPPPAVLCLVAELQRTLSQYSGGMSLILRDSGALVATTCLVATALGLATCPIGTGGESPALSALQVKYPEWAEVGGIAVGRPSAL